MSSTYGENIHLSIFGQSHSEAIGMSLDGIPAGHAINLERLNAFLARRAPGNSELSTPRKEADEPEFLSGFTYPGSSDANKMAITCGAPIAAIIRNTNTRSKDYSELKITPRPGHADHTAEIKYHGTQDYAGGGHFSGRLTAPMCIAGGICMQLLEEQNIHIFTRISSIGNVMDEGSFESFLTDRFTALSGNDISDGGKLERKLEPTARKNVSISINTQYANKIKEDLLGRPMPVISEASGQKMRDLILQKKSEGDSVGGIVECVITGIPAGLGDPMFDGMENRIAQAVFAIPAVKGIEFGSGFAAAGKTGSENNDEYCINDGKIETLTNNCGGILGGITNGMPLVFRAAFKPTPSIAKEQRTVNLQEMKETTLKVHGRHDPCIVPRALPCVEAAAALAVYDAFLGRLKEL
ncbi:MAG: chorismate synthase [Lachnospiraceae bacterium]|nr:chorismate synthase [Lachnospiraceae bacterium]